jgi:hypothetical protein
VVLRKKSEMFATNKSLLYLSKSLCNHNNIKQKAALNAETTAAIKRHSIDKKIYRFIFSFWIFHK